MRSRRAAADGMHGGSERPRRTPVLLPLAWTVATLLGFAGSVAFATSAPRALRLTVAGRAPVQWWSEASAPARWPSAGTLAEHATWRPAQPGVEWAQLLVRGSGEASTLALVAVRLDPRQVQLSLRWGLDRATAHPTWDLADAPTDAVVAVNAGMFVDALPWGWVVNRGGELLPPGRGPLSSAFIVTRSGDVAMVDGDDVSAWRARGDVAEAFQTYPTLLTSDGEVPVQLREGASIDRTHRDARLAIGLDRNGRVLLVLTRLDVAVPALDRIPVGLTVPEMAAVMGSLGARQAALLDGGISAQLRLRDRDGTVRSWSGMRQVPLALVALPR